MTITRRDIAVRGMTFRVREAGSGGEPVLLLHGFPETSHSWLGLMPKLVEAGYRCAAPDQRGYSPGARPIGVENYDADLIVDDAFAIADACGFGERFHLVAHDWGAGIGWRMVHKHPERIASWTSLSIPHPASYGKAFREDPDQQQKSQYIIMFQEPGAAEAMMEANDWALLKGIWNQHSAEEVAEYVETFSAPGAMTAALNWYRASFGGGQIDASANEFDVQTPTLTVWGNQDTAVGRSTTTNQAQYMKGYNRFVELDAGHWLLQEKPAEIASEVLAHLKKFPLG
jgi:pimeloyl-ACP methyl ester carboxylesterase